jgi:3-oxoacyl-[acyl-carrier protein] reductase
VSAARFQGATVVVTGGSRGLGRTLATAFGAEGAHVVVGYRTHAADAEETALATRAGGGSASVIGFDVREVAAVDRAFSAVIAERGQIDVLINNAGVSREGLFPMLDEEGWNDVVQTNLLGTVRCCRAAVAGMWRRRAGAIVNVASAAALAASPGLTSYASSKGGVLALTRSLAVELAPKGIRVNAVVPGFLSTGMVTRMDARVVAGKQQGIPLGRLGTAEEVARVVLFLASSDAAYIVGHALVVDGGLTL